MDKNFDVFVIGGASIDMFIFPETSEILNHDGEKEIAFSYGQKIPLSKFHMEVGGGGANTAVGLARHKLSVALFTKTGNDDYEKIIKKRLEDEKVNLRYLMRGTLNSGVSIIIQGIGRERTIFTYRGTNSEISLLDIDFEKFKGIKYILLNAIYDHTSNIVPIVIDNLKDTSTKIALSLGINEIEFLGSSLLPLLPFIDTLIVDEEESKALYHVLTNHFHSKKEKCEVCNALTDEILSFVKNHGVKNFGITLGASGVKFIDEGNQVYTLPTKQADVVNTTGIGDAFYSGYLAYKILGKSTHECLNHGIDNAVSVMGYLGSQIGLLKE